MGKRLRWYMVHPFEFPYTYIPDSEAFVAYSRKHDLNIKWPASGARTITINGSSCIVCLADKAKECSPDQIVGLLVHEATHVLQAACENVGEENPGVEFQAYAIQRITLNLMAEYTRHHVQ